MEQRLFVGNLSIDTSAMTLGKLFEQLGPVRHAEIALRDDKSRGFGYVILADPKLNQRAIEKLNGVTLDGRQIRVQIARPTAGARPATAPSAPPPHGPPRFRQPYAMGGYQQPPPPPYGGYGSFPAAFGPQGYGGYIQYPMYPPQGYGPRSFGRGFGRGRFRRTFRRPFGRRVRRTVDPNAPTSSTRVHVGNLPFVVTGEELKAAFEGYSVKEVILPHRIYDTTRNMGYGFVEFETEEEQKKFLSQHPTVTVKERICRVSASRILPPRQEQTQQTPSSSA